tara:strand:- start:1444 stop:2148 length:705 start_codon:yes stop_codon:yes gene_type:complete
MSLPQLVSPEFTTEIPSTKQKIKFRPFLVKEEKILLMASEGNDPAEMQRAVKSILSNCILTKIDVSNLATFDLEYLFLKLRGKSVGEEIELLMKHSSKSECKHQTTVKMNLDDIKIVGKVSDGKIMLDDKIGVKLKYPTFDEVAKMSENQSNTEIIYKTMAMLIEYVYTEEEVYNDFTDEEMEEWITKLNQKQFAKITDFLADMPKLSQKVEWTCSKCEEKDTVVLEGLQAFFT